MAKKKKNRNGRAAVEARKRNLFGETAQTGDTVRYKCLDCGVEEEIPRSVVEMFDTLDDEGDISVAPRFDCENCDGVMEPVKYAGVHGITYEIVESKKQNRCCKLLIWLYQWLKMVIWVLMFQTMWMRMSALRL